MTVNELYGYLNDRIPTSLSCEWDNDGRMCVPNGNREVRRVLIALDVTAEVAQKAILEHFDVILSHHPMIFRGIRGLHEDAYIAKKAMQLIGAGIAVLSFHTRLDAVDGGVNDHLCELLGLCDVVPFGEEGIGRIGKLPREMTAEMLARHVKDVLGAPSVAFADCGAFVRRVAVLGGSGAEDLDAAIAAGADAYISGELKHHQLTDAPEMGISLIVAGHYHTENPICARLAEWVVEQDQTVYCECFGSNRVCYI